MPLGKIIGPIILLLAAVGVGLVLLMPEFDHFQSIRSDTAVLQQISAEMDDLTNKRNALAERANAISREDLAKLDQAVPDSARAPEFLVSMERIAKSDGISIKRLDLGRVIQVKGKSSIASPVPVPVSPNAGDAATSGQASQQVINNMPVTISVTGRYEDFKNFLRDIETFVRIVNIQDIKFVSSLADKGRLEITARVETSYE